MGQCSDQWSRWYLFFKYKKIGWKNNFTIIKFGAKKCDIIYI